MDLVFPPEYILDQAKATWYERFRWEKLNAIANNIRTRYPSTEPVEDDLANQPTLDDYLIRRMYNFREL